MTRYVNWASNCSKFGVCDNLNTYRGKHIIGKYKKDDLYIYLCILQVAWNDIVGGNVVQASNCIRDCELFIKYNKKSNSDVIATLFCNNSYFFKAFKNFDDYCDKNLINFKLYETSYNTNSSFDLESEYINYSTNIINDRWNHQKIKLKQVLLENSIS